MFSHKLSYVIFKINSPGRKGVFSFDYTFNVITILGGVWMLKFSSMTVVKFKFIFFYYNKTWSIGINIESCWTGFYNTSQDVVTKAGTYIVTILCQMPIRTYHALLNSSSPHHLWSKNYDYYHFVDEEERRHKASMISHG